MSCKNYLKCSLKELKQICRERDISRFSTKRKEELIRIIKDYDEKKANDNILSYFNGNSVTTKKVETNIPTSNDIDNYITKLVNKIASNTDERIVLIRNEEVLRWIYGDLKFLSKCGKRDKSAEDKWGRSVLKVRRPDLVLDKQWTNKFGEHLIEEIYYLVGKKVEVPEKKENFKPDLEVEDSIIEIKTQTYFTSGTAGEKILGCPFKYADIPDLYNKNLKIVCIGGAEKLSRENYGNLKGNICSNKKKMFLDFFKEHRIEFVGVTDLIKELVRFD